MSIFTLIWWCCIAYGTLPAHSVNGKDFMKRFLMLTFLVALLGGCGLGAALDRMDQEAYQRACNSYGFQKGTDAYSNCMMQQAAQRAEDNQHAQDREALEKLKRSQ